jgi:hypothetical protein
MTYIKFILIGAFAFLVSCQGGTAYFPGKYAAVPVSQVEIVNINQLHKPYEIIGEYKGNPVMENMQDWRQEAANMGGDAMTIPQMGAHNYNRFFVIKWK